MYIITPAKGVMRLCVCRPAATYTQNRPVNRIKKKIRWIKTFSADIRISRIYAENRKFG